ncbi:MAG: TRAP transporter small permease subunit, partial [Rhodospirillum sp.]|nr:TRAP transporter small permease subunit [Rhodospirillum sp.]
ADSTSTTPSAQEVAARLGQEGQTRSTLDALIGEAGKAIAWLVLVSAAISVYEVVMRYAFNNPTSWVHETTVFLIAVIFALGGPVAMARDKHIRVRLIYDAVSPRTRRWLDMVNSVITFIFLTGMTFAAWVMFYNSTHAPTGIIQLERSGTSWNPPFPAWIKTVILISVAVMLVQTILHFIKAARGEGYEDGHPTAATDLGPGGDAAKTEG